MPALQSPTFHVSLIDPFFMGLVSVFGNDVDTYYDYLLEGQSGIGPIDRFDVSQFPTRFAGQIHGFTTDGYNMIKKKRDPQLDDYIKYVLVAGVKALQHAGLHSNKLSKSMIGHCLGAAGGLEAIAVLKAITTGWLHPTVNQFNLEPFVEFDTVANKKKQHEVNVAISNSFGFGGHNSVVAFSAFKY